MDQFILLAIICFVAMVSPGPDFILVTRNSLRYPKRQALATALGIVAGCSIHATYCVLGLALIITKSVIAFSLLKYLGAAYLIYIGVKGLFSVVHTGDTETRFEAPHQITSAQAFTQGFLCNLLNPKAAMFLFSLFTQFLSVTSSVFERAAVAGTFFIESAIYWPLLVLILQSSVVRGAFIRFQRVLDRIFGALLIALGFKVAFARD